MKKEKIGTLDWCFLIRLGKDRISIYRRRVGRDLVPAGFTATNQEENPKKENNNPKSQRSFPFC